RVRNDINRVGLVGMNIDDKSKVSRKVAADLVPVLAGIVGAQHIPVLLHEERIGTRPMKRNAVNAVANLGVLIGNVLRPESAVDRLPGLAAVIGAEGAGSGDGDVHAFGVAGINEEIGRAHV